MQETRRFKPSTIPRRFSVTAGLYRTCAIDGVLEHSPAEHVRRPAVPAESPTLGFTPLQFEALLTAACQSQHPSDFAAASRRPGYRPGSRRPHPRTVLLNSRGARMDRHAATRRLHRLAETAGIQAGRAHPLMLRHTFVTTMLDASVDLRHVQIAARHADPRTTMRYDRARQNLDRHPNYILAAFMASGI
jgi:integrase/recombinase XerD